ncbi:MAG: hypothetical protein H5T50_05195 [Nitrososphaeria archaeon]|nr:hypothetical protein [Nitrososphaeria archaeon]
MDDKKLCWAKITLILIIVFMIFFSLSRTDILPDNIRVDELILCEKDLEGEILYKRFQSRENGKDFKLIDYPIGEFGSKIDANFFEETGFIRSAGMEADLGKYRVASIALLFKNSSGAKVAYNEIISFISYRRTYDSFPYVWVPKWDNVEDIINHFIIALYNNHPTPLQGFGEESAYFYDPLNDFHYIIFRSNRLIIMVGATGSREKTFEFAKKIMFKIVNWELKSFLASNMILT